MEFNPANNVVKLCIQAMDIEARGLKDDAGKLFLQAWNEAANDFEKFLAAHFMARQQADVYFKLQWLETALQFALIVNSDSANSAIPILFSDIAKCYGEVGDIVNAQRNHEKADSFNYKIADIGPFYHGTRADLQIGDLLTAGSTSNYDAKIKMNHIYFTAQVSSAGLAAALAKGDGRERVYIIGPTGSFENDPNVTNKKFPGNPTRSYRSLAPLEIIGELNDWVKLSPEQLQQWRERLAKNNGGIIN